MEKNKKTSKEASAVLQVRNSSSNSDTSTPPKVFNFLILQLLFSRLLTMLSLGSGNC